MQSGHLVDPEIKTVIAGFPQLDFSRETLAETRQTMAAYLPRPDPSVAPGVAMNERHIPGPAGAPPIRALFYRPVEVAAPVPALLHLHGGAYVLGQPEMNDAVNRVRAEQLHCAVLSVDYRLAPETPHPGAVTDAYAALCWLRSNATELGVDPRRIAVIGESAGGGLAAALALYARDKAGPEICFQMLLYPMLDDRVGSTDEPHPYAGEFIFRREDGRKAWGYYLGHTPGLAETDPYAAPARAHDLSGLPPTFVSVGQLDLFVDENIEYVRRLIRAGVLAELHVYPGAPHGPESVPSSKIARRFIAEYMDALRRGLEIQSNMA
jgi:acetyl esterase/lipase